MTLEKKAEVMLIVPMLDQGGLERVCALTAKLVNEVYRVHLVVFNTAGMIYDVSGVHLIDLGLGAVQGKIGKTLNVFRRAWSVHKIKKALGIQLSYSFGPTANLVNVLSRHKEVVWAGIRGYGALSDIHRMQFVCRCADRVISCTKVMEKDIIARFHVNNTAVFYNPCDIEEIQNLSNLEIPEEFAAFLRRPGRTVVSMGRAHDVKGFWHLLKSVYLAGRKLSDLKLMIIGDGDYSEYRMLAQKLQIQDSVLFTGLQKNPFPLLAQADVYALTSQSEGFPNALIEAMACGLPCVSVNCKTGPAEILHQNYEEYSSSDTVCYADYGILTPVFRGDKDLNADHFTSEERIFAQELEKILTETALYMHYKDMAVERARSFGTKAYQKQLVEIMGQEEWRNH